MESYETYKSTGHEHEGLQAVPHGEHPETVRQLPVSQVPVTSYYDKASPNAGYAPYEIDKPLPRGGGRTVFGLRKQTFFLALLLALAVTAIGVVGGVFGTRQTTSGSTCASLQMVTSSITTSSSTTSSSTLSATATATSSPAVGSLITVPLDCPSENGKTVTNPYLVNGGTYTYTITCGQDCQGSNIFPIWAYTLDMCMQACVNMNNVNATDESCKAAAFRADMGNVTTLGGNCFLKTDCNSTQSQLVQIARAVLA